MSTSMRQRDAVIADYGVLAEPPKELQAVVEMAAYVAGVPLATINVITSQEQHQVAVVGFDASICRREDSMCATTLAIGGPVMVPDASRDDRFRANPFVDGTLNTVRFYAAQPLVTADDVVLGTLCVFDTAPWSLDDDQLAALGTLAERVVDLLELARRTRSLDAALVRTARLRDELQRSNEHLAAFAGQVSHDLLNPLTSVALSLNLLQEELAERPVEEQPLGGVATVERALRGTARMEALIDDLLAFARVGGELRRVEVDVAGEVTQLVGDLGAALRGAVPALGRLPVVRADRTQVRAVLQNLLVNAAKFTAPEETPRIEVGARREGAGWRIEVADRGRGVPAEGTEQLFEPLARSQAAREVEGSGIGLATCRRIVQAHGGRIGIDAREGGGAVAWVWLPDD
ncbi:MAG TPA: ATP-binding protein [Nocardioides sp.]